MGAAQSTLSSVWNIATWGPRYGIWFGKEIWEAITLFREGVTFDKWPNEVKFPIFVAGASLLGLAYNGLSPFLQIPEKIVEWVLYFQYEGIRDAVFFLKNSFFSFSKYIGVNQNLSNLVFYSFSVYVGITLLEEVLNYFLLSRLNDDEYMRVFHFLCQPITYILHYLDPAYFTKRESKFPYLSYAYDWFCTILVFPYQLLALAATPLVKLVYVPENEWVEGQETFWSRLISVEKREEDSKKK